MSVALSLQTPIHHNRSLIIGLKGKIITSWLTFALAGKVKKHFFKKSQAFADKFHLSQRAVLNQFCPVVNNGIGQQAVDPDILNPAEVSELECNGVELALFRNYRRDLWEMDNHQQYYCFIGCLSEIFKLYCFLPNRSLTWFALSKIQVNTTLVNFGGETNQKHIQLRKIQPNSSSHWSMTDFACLLHEMSHGNL